MKMFQQLACYLVVLLCVPWTVFWATLCIISSWVSTSLPQKIHTVWAQGICVLLGIRVRYDGLENLPPTGVLAPNHESLFDIIVIASLPINKHWISKKEIGRIPFVGWAMKAMGCYFVGRDGSGKDMAVMRGVEEGLRNGKRVIIFPEGTRTRTGELLPFKKGAFKTAQNAGVPVCPIGIVGTFGIAPPGQLPTKRGHSVSVHIGPPLSIAPEEELISVMERFRSELIRLLKSPG